VDGLASVLVRSTHFADRRLALADQRMPAGRLLPLPDLISSASSSSSSRLVSCRRSTVEGMADVTVLCPACGAAFVADDRSDIGVDRNAGSRPGEKRPARIFIDDELKHECKSEQAARSY
jgi:hypothetical protein